MKSSAPALTILNVLVFVGLFNWLTKPVTAAEYQNCTVSNSCIIGEFLYDDAYAPDASASCAVTSKYPNGTTFINAASTTATSNGWYSYTATTDTTEGIYPTQICCTTSTSEYLCLDKTFKVTGASSSGGATAADIWNYPTRSLTTFGSLVSDIWGYSTRSLSDFGDLVSNIWSRDQRTLTSTGDSAASLVNMAEVREIKKVTKENRLLLEQLINKPIVKTFIDDTGALSLSEKIERTKTSAANLYSGVQNLKSRSEILNDKWSTLSSEEIKAELNTLANILKQDIGQKDTSILATSTWLKSSWNSPVLADLSDQAQSSASQINNTLNNLNLYSSTSQPTSFITALTHINKLHSLVGTSIATASDLNLFGFIKKTAEEIALLDRKTNEGLALLTEIKKDPKKDQTGAISTYNQSVLASNKLPQVDTFFQKTLKNTNTPFNKVLGLLAIIDTNRQLLVSNTGQTLKYIWLEEGSIVFRAVAINPSGAISQKVTVKYYLPTEVKKEQIINHDQELAIDYDPIENALFASGEINLAPLETRTFLVEVEDIWSFKQAEIDSLKTQANELSAALGTSSATSIKTDIVVALDKIMLRQANAVTPENRIKTYRESSLDMNGVEEKINNLKEMISQSGGAYKTSSVTIWGLVLISLAILGFAIIYFNALRLESRRRRAELVTAVTTPAEKHQEIYHPAPPKHRHRDTPKHPWHRIARITSIAFLASGIGSVGVSLAIKSTRSHPVALVSPAPNAQILGANTNLTFPYKTSLSLGTLTKVPVRTSPSFSAPQIFSLGEDQTVHVFRVVGDWAQVGLSEADSSKQWWLGLQYLDRK